MVFKVFRAKWYYPLTGIFVPLLFSLVWLFYTAIFYFSKYASGTAPGLSDFLVYGIVTVLCALFILSGLLMGWASHIKIVIGNGRVTYLYKKNRTELKLSEITRVEHTRGFPFPGLKLSSAHKTIKIFKDIDCYDELYEILRQNVPALSMIEKAPLPEKMLASNEILAIVIVIALMALTIIAIGIVAFLTDSLPLVVLCALLVLTIVILGTIKLYPWLNRPYMYLFTGSGITACMLLRKEEINRIMIKDIRLGETTRKVDMVKMPIKAVFIESRDGKTFTIEDGQLRYPIEMIYGMLKQTYGK